MDRLLATLRARGAVIIHAPSGCMAAYDGTLARARAQAALPAAELLPDGIDSRGHGTASCCCTCAFFHLGPLETLRLRYHPAAGIRRHRRVAIQLRWRAARDRRRHAGGTGPERRGVERPADSHTHDQMWGRVFNSSVRIEFQGSFRNGVANGYPIDQRGDTGQVGDDSPMEHAAWHRALGASGLFSPTDRSDPPPPHTPPPPPHTHTHTHTHTTTTPTTASTSPRTHHATTQHANNSHPPCMPSRCITPHWSPAAAAGGKGWRLTRRLSLPIGRSHVNPITHQTAALTIDQSVDYISDVGSEVWGVLQSRGIDNVLLVGVHTNVRAPGWMAHGPWTSLLQAGFHLPANAPFRSCRAMHSHAGLIAPARAHRLHIAVSSETADTCSAPAALCRSQMCVLGRPFGLRQLSRLGKNVALVPPPLLLVSLPSPIPSI